MTSPNIARLHIALLGTEPLIWRRVDVPLAFSLADLHEVIQIVMPWDDCHLFEFEMDGVRYGVPDPQAEPDPGLRDADDMKLAVLIGQGAEDFVYVYDFGDDWRHRITVEALEVGAPKVKYPRYVDGAWAAPPEDVGGVAGFGDFLHAITKGSARAKREMLDWHGGPYDPAVVDVRQIEAELGEIAMVVKAARG